MIDLLARAMMRSPLLKLTRLVMALMLAFGSLLAVPAVAAEAAPTITSDQADYPPGATVTLTGANWAPAELVRIVVNDTIGQSWQRDVTITASDTGVVTDVFQLPNYFVSNYDVTAIGPTSGTATTTFTDLSIGTYDQCSNDLGTGYASGDTGCRWINGNLQGNNSRYFEGDATVQRLWLTGLTNGAHSVTLQYGTTKGGKHAYDYLTNWDWSENWVTLADRCQGITNCMTWSTSTLQIPDDPNVSNTIEPVPGGRVFTMYNGSLTSASTPTIVSGSYAGDSETSITVSFNVNTSTAKDCTGSPLTCSVVLIFGAHVSSQVDWGVGNGAGSISGSPYHVSLAAVDGASVGSRDNQMQAGTIVANGTIVIVKDAQPNDAQDFSFTLTNGTTINQSFSLDDDSDATLPSSRSFSVPPGTYSAQETNIPANWSLAGLTCVDPTSNTTVNLASATASINLASGETVTCTYVDSQQNPNLTITKTADAATVNAGDQVGYTISVQNGGPGTANNVVLTDALPANPGLSWTVAGVTGSGGYTPPANACSISSGTLTCNFGSIGSGGSVSVHITSPTTPASCGTITNSASVTSSNGGTKSTGQVTITVNCPDVKVEKTADNSPIDAGDTAAFTIVVSNIGAGTAKNVTLNDPLPSGVTWSISPAVSGCAIASGTLSCSFATLAAGASVTIHVSGTTSAANCGTLPNTATVSATNEAAGANANNTSSATITVNCGSIQITKTADAASVSAGDPIGFTITVTNGGAGTAKGVTVSDTLPTNGGLSWSISPAVSGCAITSGVLTCTFGDLAAGASKSVHISSPTTPASCGTVSNTASVTTTNDGSGTASASVTVQCPSLTVTKTADAATVDAGDPIGFTITVSNGGPGVAKSVTLSDALPTGTGISWTISPAYAGPGTCAISAGALSCSFGDLAAGASVSIHITSPTTAQSCATYPNTATAQATNNAAVQASASVTVNCATIQISKTADASSVDAGDQIGFTITVTNGGVGTANGVVVNDTLPTNAGTSWTIDAGGSSSGCSISSGVLTCNFGSMAGGTSKHVHITSPTTPATCGTVDNTASVTTSNDGSGTASASITVNCPDVKVVKTAANGTINAGDTASFSIVVSNIGAGTAKGVTLSDTLPSGVVWSLGGPDAANCSISGSSLTCTFGDLAPNATRTITVSGTTDAADCGVLSNSASASTTNEPSDKLANNTSSDSITVRCPDVVDIKTATTPTVSAGDPVAFSIAVSNNGPGTAYNVALNDPLPGNAGLDWDIVSASPGLNCTISGAVGSEVLSCSIASLAAGASVSVTVGSGTTAASCATISNTATASASNEPSANTGNNTSTASLTVDCPDVKVEKTADSGTINAGDTAAFTIVVTNIGAGIARNVTLTDNLPAGVTWSEDSADCSITAGVLSCSFGDLAAGATRTIHVSGTTDAADCGPLSNTATVSATNEPSNKLSNNSSTAVITVNCPNVTVVKTADSGTINAGDTASFTIVVSNSGPGAAYNVTLSDQLPAGVAWSVGGPDGAACSIDGNGLLTCSFGTLAAGASTTITVSGTTDPADCGTLTNSVTVAASNEANTADNSSTASITVSCPNVMVSKTADHSPINAGDTAAFTIVVSNIGQGTAYDVTLTDNLPAGVAWSISPAVTGCDIQTGTLSCSLGDLAAGASVEIHISGVTDAADCGVLSNTATVAATNEAAVAQGNNSSTATITVNCPQVVNLKTTSTATVSAGDLIKFSITVKNEGPGAAYNVTLSDPLPSGIAWSEDPDSADCTISGQLLSCTYGTLAANESRTVTVSGQSSAADCGVVTNTATASASNEPSSALGDNVSTATVTVLCPNVTVSKTADSGTISAGDVAAFTIVLANSGTGTAYNVTLTDNLPAGVAWALDPAVTGCAINSGVLSCSIASLATGASVEIHISGVTDAADCGVLTNTATASASNEAADNTADNSSSATITVDCPDVTVVKTADSGTINAGDTASFTIVVSNSGAGTAKGVTLTDNLPAGVAWSISPAVTGCDIQTGTLSCSLGDLAAGDSVTIHISGVTDAADCGTLHNLATVAATNERASDEQNNSDDADIVVNCPNVTVVKTADSGTISAGDTAAFTIVVSNSGTGIARNVTLTDSLPAGVAWSISPAVTGCDIQAGTLSCSLGDLAAGASVTIHISGVTDAADCGVLSNTATVAASNEANTGDNSSTATITVQCPNVTVVKTADSGTINAGDTASFTIVVSNSGPGAAYNVTLSDQLPAGVAWSVGGADGAACSIDGNGLLTCSFGTLAAGASTTITVSGTTDPADCGTLTNSVTVAASNEANTADNSSTASITVSCPNVMVSKTADHSPINAGDTAAFTIVVSNIGQGTAYDVTLTDQLPAGVAWSISPAVTGCDIQTGTLSCSLGDLAAGDSVTIHISGVTDAADCGVLSNTATVAATNEAAVAQGNNSSTATITVNCPQVVNLKTTSTATVSAGDLIKFSITVKNEGRARPTT
ncbi:MAG: DUF11 domain-containing protein [Kouleothrix sp.]|nr:DUF11 domain-containing protein [Kouleothrix sp.]